MRAFYEEGFNEELSVRDGLWALLDTNCDHPVNVEYAYHSGTLELLENDEQTLIKVSRDNKDLAYLNPDCKLEYLADVIQWILTRA